MRRVGGAQPFQRLLRHPAAVSGGDGRAKSADHAALHVDDAGTNGPPETPDKQSALPRRSHQNRVTGVPNGAQPLKPGVAAEIKAARFNRSARRRQMPGRHHTLAGLEIERRQISMQRHAHLIRCFPGRHTLQHNLIQAQPNRVRRRPVDAHDAPLDRAIIAPPQHLGGDSMRPQASGGEAACHQHNRPSQRCKAARTADGANGGNCSN